MCKEIKLTVENGVATLSVQRPEVFNALSRTLVDEMDRLLDQIAADPSIRVLLPRLIGEAKAKELIFMSRIVSGEEAAQIGLVNTAVEREQLLETAQAWTKKLLQKSSVTLAAAKDCIAFGGATADPAQAIAHEAAVWAGLFETEDQKEGMRAFFEKRHPKFCGR